MNIWKGILAAFMLAAVFGCGMGTSKKNGSGEVAEQLPRLCVTGTQLMNEKEIQWY